MSNYNKATNFSVKDTLTSGDPDKVVSGAEIDNEFDAISSAVTSKADKVAAATTDNIATLDANGNIKDGGLTIVSVAPPVGSVTMYAASAAPSGWLECDGSNVNRSTFSDLFDAIGTVFGEGDGSTTFGLPDLRGEFVRGWDNGRNVDDGRSFGSNQLDQMQRVTGQFDALTRDEQLSQGAFSVENSSGDIDTGGGGDRFKKHSFDSANSPNARTSSSTDGETRPRNIALMYIIKT